MCSFPWVHHLNTNQDPNWQVKTFTNIFMNIMTNFITNEIKRIVPRDPSWITKPLITMLNRKNRLFKNYKRHGYKPEDKVRLDKRHGYKPEDKVRLDKRHGYKPEDKVRLDNFRKECQEAVEVAKLNYLTNMGDKLNNSNTSRKSYWKIINKVMNK